MEIKTFKELVIPGTKYVWNDQRLPDTALSNPYFFVVPEEVKAKMDRHTLYDSKYQIMQDGEIRMVTPEGEEHSISKWLLEFSGGRVSFVVVADTPQGYLSLVVRGANGLVTHARARHQSDCFNHISDVSGIMRAYNKPHRE